MLNRKVKWRHPWRRPLLAMSLALALGAASSIAGTPLTHQMNWTAPDGTPRSLSFVGTRDERAITGTATFRESDYQVSATIMGTTLVGTATSAEGAPVVTFSGELGEDGRLRGTARFRSRVQRWELPTALSEQLIPSPR